MSDSERQMGDCVHAKTPDWCVLCLRAEVERLKAGRFTEEEFQALCHQFGEDDACRFFQGCTEYQRRLFGRDAVAAEREACAQEAEYYLIYDERRIGLGKRVADAIRKRGEANASDR